MLLASHCGAILAHEIESNRATLVLRDRQHLSMTLYLDLVAVLHLTLAPKETQASFLLKYAAMAPDEFQKNLLLAQKKLQGNTFVSLPSGKKLSLTQWVWPDRASLQALFQQKAMQAVVAPSDHAHVLPSEVRAEAKSTSSEDFSAVKLQFPSEFQQVLVVYYQPRQIWVKPDQASAPIRF
jgi:hypothetical protein